MVVERYGNMPIETLRRRFDNISGLRVGDTCRVKGRITKIIDSKKYYISDHTGKLLVYDDTNARIVKGDEITVQGTVARAKATFSRAIGISYAVFVFLLAGIFGWTILNITVTSPFGFPATILFPALSGLFGLATLLISVKDNPTIPKQHIEAPKIDKPETGKSIAIGTTAGSTVGFLPGLSAGLATIVAMIFRKDTQREQVIVTLSSINTANAFFVLVALFLILRPRSGAAISVNNLIGVEQWDSILMPEGLAYCLIAGLFAAIISFFVTLYIGKKFASVFDKIPYRKIISSIIIFIIVGVFIFTGVIGLFVLAVATAIGLIPPFLGVRRSHAMAVLLVPVIIMLW